MRSIYKLHTSYSRNYNQIGWNTYDRTLTDFELCLKIIVSDTWYYGKIALKYNEMLLENRNMSFDATHMRQRSKQKHIISSRKL